MYYDNETVNLLSYPTNYIELIPVNRMLALGSLFECQERDGDEDEEEKEEEEEEEEALSEGEGKGGRVGRKRKERTDNINKTKE